MLPQIQLAREAAAFGGSLLTDPAATGQYARAIDRNLEAVNGRSRLASRISYVHVSPKRSVSSS